MKHPAAITFVVLVTSLLGLGCLKSTGAEAPPETGEPAQVEETNVQDTLRGYLQIQEQLHATQLAIEQTRQENAEAAARNAEALAARLQTIEGALSSQRSRELEAMQSSNRVMLLMVGTFAFVGVAAMLLMTFFQWRTVHGLAALSADPHSVRSQGTLETGDVPAGQIERSSARLLGSLEQLERRIHQLEHDTRPTLGEGATDEGVSSPAARGANGNGEEAGGPSPAPGLAATATPGGPDRLKQLLGTGQTLLDHDRPDAALSCFDEALTLEPCQGEALVKKGIALERLQRLDEAIACYDEAIAADSSLTIAYLHKGGLFNRLEKYAEALECYELALRTQEKQVA